MLEEINPKSVAHICSAAGKLGAVSAYMDREAEKLCRLSTVRYQNEVQILKFSFYQGDEVLRVPVLQKCVEYLCGSLANITEEHLEKLLALFEMQTGKEIHLPYGIVAVRTYEGIRMFFRKEKKVTKKAKKLAKRLKHAKFRYYKRLVLMSAMEILFVYMWIKTM